MEIGFVLALLEGCDDGDDNFVFEARFLQQLRDCCTSDVAPVELRQKVILKLKGASPPPATT